MQSKSRPVATAEGNVAPPQSPKFATVRGAYVETHAKGVNRIKGGSVKIN